VGHMNHGGADASQSGEPKGRAPEPHDTRRAAWRRANGKTPDTP
jgi:hypothetical protein